MPAEAIAKEGRCSRRTLRPADASVGQFGKSYPVTVTAHRPSCRRGYGGPSTC